MKYLIIVFAVLLTGKVSGQTNCNCQHRYAILWDAWQPDSTDKVNKGHADEGYGYVKSDMPPTKAQMLVCLKKVLKGWGRRLTNISILSIQVEDGGNSYLGWAIIYPVADGINNLTNFKQ